MSSNPRRGKKGPSPNPEECPKIPMFLNPEGDKMSEVKWTEEQSQAIHEKGSNILVAAAAGSGKTAVLVERIINKIIRITCHRPIRNSRNGLQVGGHAFLG